jgi:Zn-dependent M16 (insulinase) family peptidase
MKLYDTEFKGESMSTLKYYQEQWEIDSVIDKDAIEDESLKVPRLHSKWMNFLSTERSIYKKLQKKKEQQLQVLEDYYNGIIDGKDIGRDPFQITVTKAGAKSRAENDELTVKIQNILDDKEEIVLFIKEVVTSVNFRNSTIKNHIDWMRWSQGG